MALSLGPIEIHSPFHADHARDPLALSDRLARAVPVGPLRPRRGMLRALRAAAWTAGGAPGRRDVVGRGAETLARRARTPGPWPAPARGVGGATAAARRPGPGRGPARHARGARELPPRPRSEPEPPARPRRPLPALPHAPRRPRAPPHPVAPGATCAVPRATCSGRRAGPDGTRRAWPGSRIAGPRPLPRHPPRRRPSPPGFTALGPPVPKCRRCWRAGRAHPAGGAW